MTVFKIYKKLASRVGEMEDSCHAWKRDLLSLLIVMMTACLTASAQSAATRYATHSVLRSGTWVKIRIPETGIYQLSDELLRNAGFSDPSKVKIYGYGGNMLSEVLTPQVITELDDLKEVATCTVNGRRLFHANGPWTWASRMASERIRNPYSDYGYYFLTQSSGNPLSVDSASFVSSFHSDPFYTHSLCEKDEFAWIEGGRNLFEAEPMQVGDSHTYTLQASPQSTSGVLSIAITTSNVSEATVHFNDSLLGTAISMNDKTVDFDKAQRRKNTFSVKNVRAKNTVKVTVTNGSTVRMDYVSLATSYPLPFKPLSTSSFPVPELVGAVENQDLHADAGYEMVIIEPASKLFHNEAERLKAFHEEHDGMKVKLVSADMLYNEFSSGTPDATAYRRYMKMLYDKASSQQPAPKYLLLFGDSFWDNRMNTADLKEKFSPDDFLLCYESDNSHNKVNCYTNEGYFTYLEDNSGNSPLTRDMMQVAVGRFPVRTLGEAKVMVDKTINYSINTDPGAWQNKVVFLGDDGNDNVHMQDAVTAREFLRESNTTIFTENLFWDTFKAVSKGSGRTYPDVTKRYLELLYSGSLIFDYSGHGGEVGLSHEECLMMSEFRDVTNTRLPLWITAACDIMPFEGKLPNIGEASVLNSKGGTVAFLGTVRTAYNNKSREMNGRFLKNLFQPVAGKYISVGEAVRLAKNELITSGCDMTVNKLQYALLGDPALFLHIPYKGVIIDEINGVSTKGSQLPRLKAGAKVNVKGHIEKNGTKLTDFNGKVSILLCDALQHVVCKLNNKSSDGAQEAFEYDDYISQLQRSEATVAGGSFTMEFVMPMDILYSNQPGLMSFYATSNDGQELYNGTSEHFTIGEMDMNAISQESASITCYLDSPDFKNGDTVGDSPTFFASAKIPNGINLMGSGVGREIKLIIDNDPSTTYKLTSFFQPDADSYTTGTVEYAISSLNEGPHTLLLQIYDVYNHIYSKEISFNVETGYEHELLKAHSISDLVRNNASFVLTHNRSGKKMQIELDITDAEGNPITSLNETCIPAESTRRMDWNLKDSNGQLVPAGVYWWRFRMTSDEACKMSAPQKLIVVR